MKSSEAYKYLNRVAVIKNMTGSVQVQTPTGPVLVSQPGMVYVLADGAEQVHALAQYPGNLSRLLNNKQIALVY